MALSETGLYTTERTHAVILGVMTPLHYAQFQQWFEIFLAGPTRNVVGKRSNDFTGLYYYDPSREREWVLVFSGVTDWRTATLDRRIVYENLLLGLFSEVEWLQQPKMEIWNGPRHDMPTQWEALSCLIEHSLELLPLPQVSAGEPDWLQIAQECTRALDSPQVQHHLTSKLRTTVYNSFWANYSMYGQNKEPDWIELFCNASIARSMVLASEHPELKHLYKNGSRLASVLPRFFRSDLGYFDNAYPLTPNKPEAGRPGSQRFTEGWEKGVVDLWYVLDNLRKILEIVKVVKQRSLRQTSYSAAKTMLSVAKSMHFMFPLFGEMSEGAIRGCALNPAALGIFSLVMVLAAEIFQKDREEFQVAAETGLQILRRFPLDMCYHEPHQFACAAKAANALFKMSNNGQYKVWRDDFTRASLLMMYRDAEKAGLFQSCAGLLYPSFRESVETIEPFLEWMDSTHLPLRTIIQLGLRNNERFIHKDGQREGLPQEGIKTSEMPGAASIGTAVYAAGQIFDLARIQHRLAQHLHR